MLKVVDHNGVQDLAARGARLVEVLPSEEYEEGHLPGAINLPLKELDAERAASLDRDTPVVVYCWDALCDMSPRAASWLARLGFDAYDYALGKVDWMAHGLPLEGSTETAPTALSFLRDDVATCELGERAEEIRRRIDASPYGFALVLAGRVVLGRVRGSRLDGAPADASAQALMEFGPSTTRPHTDAKELADRLRAAGASVAILTSPDGILLGVARSAELEAR
jgi:rhodanese-related sulfurtransferase